MFKSKALRRELAQCHEQRNEALSVLSAIESHVAVIEFSQRAKY